MNMKTLKRNLEISNSKPTNEMYQPIPTNKSIDANYSSFRSKKEVPKMIRKANLFKNNLVKSNKDNKLNIRAIIKRYLLTFFIFIILSHKEFDMIANIEEMNMLYRIILKALIFTITQIILNNTL
jgi:hypothetical protein